MHYYQIFLHSLRVKDWRISLHSFTWVPAWIGAVFMVEIYSLLAEHRRLKRVMFQRIVGISCHFLVNNRRIRVVDADLDYIS